MISQAIPGSPEVSALEADLGAVNEALWEIEDDIRTHDARGDFGPELVRLSQAVYRANDLWAAIKRDINRLTGSALVEANSYHKHGACAHGH
jgi:hypothetical protein